MGWKLRRALLALQWSRHPCIAKRLHSVWADRLAVQLGGPAMGHRKHRVQSEEPTNTTSNYAHRAPQPHGRAPTRKSSVIEENLRRFAPLPDPTAPSSPRPRFQVGPRLVARAQSLRRGSSPYAADLRTAVHSAIPGPMVSAANGERGPNQPRFRPLSHTNVPLCLDV